MGQEFKLKQVLNSNRHMTLFLDLTFSFDLSIHIHIQRSNEQVDFSYQICCSTRNFEISLKASVFLSWSPFNG